MTKGIERQREGGGELNVGGSNVKGKENMESNKDEDVKTTSSEKPSDLASVELSKWA